MEKREAKGMIVEKFPILGFFEYRHLPEHLQKISKPFRDLAFEMVDPYDEFKVSGDMKVREHGMAETAAGLRKLLEAKDCFVRAALSP